MEDFNETTDEIVDDLEDTEGSSIATAAVFGVGAITGAAVVASYRKVKTFARARLDAYADSRELKKLAKENQTEEA